MPNPMDVMGVEFQDETFVEGIRMWSVDQLDMSVRIDLTIGWMRDIFLGPEMGGDNNITGRSDLVGGRIWWDGRIWLGGRIWWGGRIWSGGRIWWDGRIWSAVAVEGFAVVHIGLV